MKCLVVTNTDRIIKVFFIPHIRLLQNMGFEVSVATAVTDVKSLEKALPGVTFHHIPFQRNLNPFDNAKVYFSLRKLLKQMEYDLIHVHTPIASFLVRLAAQKGQPVIYTAHGFHFHDNGSRISNWLYLTIERVMERKTTKLIVINEEDYLQAKEIFPPDKIYFINGVGIDSSVFNPEKYTNSMKSSIKERLHIDGHKKVITHLAEFNSNKRQIDIVLAAEQLKEYNQEFIFLLLGDGPLKDEIQNEIQSRNLEPYIRCLGYRTDIEDILSITDIGLLVSIREGLPKSVMEMMAMEIPLIVTDIRGNRDLVQSENGFIIPIQSPIDLMTSCLTLIQDENLRQTMGRAGRKKILERFDLRIILEELQTVYEASLYPMARGVVYERQSDLKQLP
ncbi:glycosyltransferase family 4 protein [Ornithinibacillus bavariensis]|uniref:glycosyltransferase family 4 protein n=1 Tax=Ornithinibacillus bavariensis TaxID=545502 RepID=UPI000EC95E76|nr:glycosyltransferase family 1 protein [Ornithinibacillus sp.]